MKLTKFNLIILIIVIAFLYFPTKDIFFQQDRWLVMGKILSLGSGYIFLDFPGIFRTIFGEGRFLARVVTYLLMTNPFNATPSNLYSIIIHTINALLAYRLTNNITGIKKISFWAALFFAVSGVSFSAVIWSAASVVTLTSTFFILISLIYYFNYLKNDIKRYLFICFLSLFLSLQFKEIGILLFLIYPLGLALYKKIQISGLLKKYWLLITILLSVIFYRLVYFKKFSEPVAMYLTGANQDYLITLLSRLFYYPFISLSQTLVPAQYSLILSRKLTDILFPSYQGVSYLVMAETVSLDLLSAIVSTAVVIIVFFIYRKSNFIQRKNIIFLFLFVLSSFVPYIIVKKGFSYLDSRFYYLGVLGMSILLAQLFAVIKVHKKNILYIILLLQLIPHVLIVRDEIQKQVDISKVRNEFISKFNNLETQDKYKNKRVFYITGDSDYYLVGHKVPFQSGMGYILMVLAYNNFRNLPIDMLKQGYLFEIGSQGYKEIDGVGYGYFSDTNQLITAVNDNNINKNLIMSLYYNSKTQELTATTYDKK